MSWRARLSSFVVFVAIAVSSRAVRARTGTASAAVSLGAEEVDVEEVGVSAARPRVADPSATSAKVSAERLARARARGDDLGAIADAVPGARVLDLGGTVAERRITVRGGSPAQALVIVDGVRLSSPFATGLDLGAIGVESLESIELVRGGAGALLGEGALTGALIVETRKAKRQPEEAFLLSYGAFGTTRIAASGSVQPIALSGSFERTAGDFPYVSRIRGLPDRDAIRENSDATRGTLSLRADGSFAGNELTAIGGASLREGGVPGLETQTQRSARERRTTAYLRTALHHLLQSTPEAPLSQSILLQTAPEVPLSQSILLQTAPEVPTTGDASHAAREPAEAAVTAPRATASSLAFGVSASVLDIAYHDDALILPSSSATTFYSLGADATATLAILDRHLLRASADLEREASQSTIHGSPARARAGLALSDELVFDNLSLFAALRTERLYDGTIALLPRAGLSLALGDAIQLALGLGRSVRAPAIDELYHPPEPGFSGNPDLRPETAWEADASFAFTPAHDLPALRIAAFARTISDTILYVNRNAFEVRPENAGNARALGGEAELTFAKRALDVAWSLEASAALLFAELTATGEPIPTQPKWSAAAELAAHHGIAGISTSLRAFAPTTANLQGTLEVPAYLRWDTALTLAPVEGATISLSLTNLLDDRTLETVHKIPLPGRALFASVRISTEAPQ